MSFTPLSNNPVNNDSLSGLFRLILRKWTQYQDNQLPASVISYNRATNRAQVQPMILVLTTTGMQIKRAQVVSVPVRSWGGGGTIINSNLTAGNLGWLHANDRDISLFKQSYKQSPPNTKRFHSFEDAVFEPDPQTGFTINGNHPNDFVIQSLDGTSCAAFNTANNCVVACDSTTKAFAPPRMTTAQKLAIPSPFPGMMVYDLTRDGLAVYTAANGWG